MILDTGKKQFRIVREVLTGTKNDVYVCQDAYSSVTDYKTLWKIKDRAVARGLLEAFQNNKGTFLYQDTFVIGDNLYFLLPYENERPLERFYLGTLEGGVKNDQIWLELVTLCMTSGLPDGLLFLILTQKQIQIGPDGSIHFGYFLDLSRYDKTVGRKECARLCAQEILLLMKQEKNNSHMAGDLLKRKLGRSDYSDFIEIYKDLRLLSEPVEKRNFLEFIKAALKKREALLYRIMFGISSALAAIVLCMLIFRFVFGDASFYRLFSRPLERIGTESLLQ